MAAAWEQAGELRATVAALNARRLAAEVGAQPDPARGRALADADLLQLTARMHAFLRAGDDDRPRAGSRPAPCPAASSPRRYLRQTRPGHAARARLDGAHRRRGARLGADHVAARRSPPAAPPGRRSRRARVRRRSASRTAPRSPTGRSTDVVDRRSRRRRAGRAAPRVLGARTATAPPRSGAGRTPDRPAPASPAAPGSSDVSGIAGDGARARSTRSPRCAASLLARIPALDGLLPPTRCRRTLALAPVFEDPLSDDLTRLGASGCCPGVGRAPAQPRAAGRTEPDVRRRRSWSAPTTSWPASCSGAATRSTCARRSSTASGTTSTSRAEPTSASSPAGRRTTSIAENMAASGDDDRP